TCALPISAERVRELCPDSRVQLAQRKCRLAKRPLRFPSTFDAPGPSGWHEALRALRVLCAAQGHAQAEDSPRSRTRSKTRKLRPRAAQPEGIGIRLPKIPGATLRKPDAQYLNQDNAGQDRLRWCPVLLWPLAMLHSILAAPSRKKHRGFP